MKNKIITIRVLFSLFIAFMISCSDDDLIKSEGGGEELEQSNILNGWDYENEGDWSNFTVLKDINQLVNLNGQSKTRNNGSTIKAIDVVKDDFKYLTQGKYGTCISIATANAYAIALKKRNGISLKSNGMDFPFESNRYSASFLHRMAVRTPRDMPNVEESNADFVEIFKIVEEYGVPTEADWPYENITKDPMGNKGIGDKASLNTFKKRGVKTSDYKRFRVFSIEDDYREKTKSAINLGYPTVIAVFHPVLKINNKIFHRLHDGDVIGEEELKKDVYSNNLLGFDGHAMTIIGYDNDKIHGKSKGAFLVLNSISNKLEENRGSGGFINSKWGGKDGADPGCFWLMYDAFDFAIDYKQLKNDEIPKFTFEGREVQHRRYIARMAIIGVPKVEVDTENTKEVKSIFFDFNGYASKAIDHSSYNISLDPYGSNVRNGSDMIANIKLNRSDYIKYPSETVIPRNGTIEMEFKVDDFTHELTDFKTGEYPTDSKEMIDSIWTDPDFKGWDDRQNSTVIFSTYIKGKSNSVDGFSLRVNKNGEAILEFGVKDYVDPTDEELVNPKPQIITNEYLLLGSLDVKGGWNKIALSIDNQGNIITLINGRGSLIANSIHKKFGTAQKKFTIGESHTVERYFYYKIYELIEKPNGAIEKELLNIKRYKYNLEEGFIGNIKSFRTSDISENWVITKGTNSKVYKRIN